MNRSTRNKIVGGAALAAGIYAGIQYARRRHRRSLPALAADTFRHERVNVNGVALHCAISGAGPTVLMLHGFPEAWFLWEPLLSKLPEWNYQGVAPDMRGYNLSDKPANIPDYRLSELVEDVRGLLEQYSPGRKAVLIGHDWGGIVAWAFAAAYPEMLEKLVILNAPHPNVFARELTHNPAQQMASSYAPLFRSRFAETALSAFDCFLLRKMMFRTAPPGTFSPQKKAQLFAAWDAARRPDRRTELLSRYGQRFARRERAKTFAGASCGRLSEN